jgi:hypothetical protein
MIVPILEQKGFSRTVSFTLVLLLRQSDVGNQQGLISSRCLRCHICGRSLPHFSSNGDVHSTLENNLVTGVLFDYLLPAFSGK